jgi:hypothetical protein
MFSTGFRPRTQRVSGTLHPSAEKPSGLQHAVVARQCDDSRPTLSLKRRHCVNLPQGSPPTARGILTPHRCLGPLRAFGSCVVPSLYAWLSCCPSPPSRRLPSATRPSRLLPAAADTASAVARNHTPSRPPGRNSPTRSASTAVPSRLPIQRLRTVWFGPHAAGAHRVTELSHGFRLSSPIPSPASRAMLSASVRLPPLPSSLTHQLLCR